MIIIQNTVRILLLMSAFVVGFVVAGCDDKENTVDIDTPGGSVEIERDMDTGEVDVEITTDRSRIPVVERDHQPPQHDLIKPGCSIHVIDVNLEPADWIHFRFGLAHFSHGKS